MRVGDYGGFCGGTLVASKYVITAAHCMFEYWDDLVVGVTTAEEISVMVGEHNRWQQGETNIPEKRIDVKRIINHPNYDQPMNAAWVGPRLGHDISILELEEEVDLNVYTPACLAEAADFHTYDGKMVTAAGWGANRTHSGLDAPHEVEVAVYECPWYREYVDSILCTRDPSGENGKGTWKGDSGGPITFKTGDQHVLVGDVSGGSGPGKWNFHCRISAVRDWIDQTLSGATFCGTPNSD